MLSDRGTMGDGSGSGFAAPSFRVVDFADFLAADGGCFAAGFLAVFFIVRRVWFGLRVGWWKS
jgi:hypothetical protein